MKQKTLYSRYTVLDVEHAADAPSTVCSVGIAVLEDGKVVFNGTWLVRPPDNRYSYWHTKVHGLGPADTAKSPLLSEVWPELLPHLENSVLTGHNIKQDLRSLRAALLLQGVKLGELPYFDTIPLARLVLGAEGYDGKLGLATLAKHLQLQHTAHDAGSDALVNLQLLDYLLSRLPDYQLPQGWKVIGS